MITEYHVLLYHKKKACAYTNSTLQAYITFKAGTNVALLRCTLLVKHWMVQNNCTKETIGYGRSSFIRSSYRPILNKVDTVGPIVLPSPITLQKKISSCHTPAKSYVNYNSNNRWTNFSRVEIHTKVANPDLKAYELYQCDHQDVQSHCPCRNRNPICNTKHNIF